MYKSQISRIFALFALLAMLSGCGEKEMTGQIFVVTQGKDNIKLALVTVGAIPQEEFDQYLKAPGRNRGFGNEDFFIKNLPQPKFISKTDADGKFALTLPSGKYVITANSSREVFGSTETYHWLVTVDTSNINQPLVLSNDNFLETKCNECVKF